MRNNGFLNLNVTIHGCYPARCFYALAHENPEAAGAIWGRMLHICASRSVLLDTECTVTLNIGVKNFLLHHTSSFPHSPSVPLPIPAAYR